MKPENMTREAVVEAARAWAEWRIAYGGLRSHDTEDALMDAVIALDKPDSPLPSDEELDALGDGSSIGRHRAIYAHALRLAAERLPPSVVDKGPGEYRDTLFAWATEMEERK